MMSWLVLKSVLSFISPCLCVTYKIIQQCVQKKENCVQCVHATHQLPSADQQKVNDSIITSKDQLSCNQMFIPIGKLLRLCLSDMRRTKMSGTEI